MRVKSADTQKTLAVLSENVRGLMTLRQWSEHELAQVSGVAQKTINNLLNLRGSCTVTTAELIARAFGLTAWQLLMQDLPTQIQTSPTLSALVGDWLNASAEGRELISKIAHREGHRGDGTNGP